MSNAQLDHLETPATPEPRCATCSDAGAYYPAGAEFAVRCTCGALFDRRLFRFAPRAKAKPKTDAAPKAARKVRPAYICGDCELTWNDLVGRPDFHWRNLDFIAMTACNRCERYSCHHCYARDNNSYGVLCAACFALPEPTDADLLTHPRVQRQDQPYKAAEIASVRRGIAWRYAAPAGQHSPISPPKIWIAHQSPDVRGERGSKESNRRYQICCGFEAPKAADDAWLPPAIRDYLAQRQRGAELDDGWDDAEASDE